MTLAWLIIGGGIHGVHLAARLLGEAGVDENRLRVVDPGARLLERWRASTATTGMTHLRSPSVHHLDLSPLSLPDFLTEHAPDDTEAPFAPVDRPALALFNAHCDQVIDTYGLAGLHLRARAESCVIGQEVVAVRLSTGSSIAARNVVLALGTSEQPEWPTWAPRGEARVAHVFAPGFDAWPSTRETVAVVGGGISAGQVALRLLDEGHDVHVISRHAQREHDFDWDPGWLGPKLMTGFRAGRGVERRRALIAEGRYRGSVPPDVQRALHQAIAGRRLTWRESGVDGLEAGAQAVTLRLATGATLDAHRVLLATGFTVERPGGAFVDDLVRSASLPVAPCGYPIVDEALRWHPRIRVSGPLAELELGPVSRNIAGARRAGDRLVGMLRR